MAVDIRRVERARPDETGFVGTFEVERAAQPIDQPWAPAPDLTEARAWFQHVDPSRTLIRYAAWHDDQVVAVGGIGIPLDDNTDKAYVGVTVHPDARRRGVGTALTEQLLSVAGEHGRTTVVSGLTAPSNTGEDHPSRAFARSVGFVRSITEIERQLDLPVDPAVLDRLEAETRPHYVDRYTVEVHHDGLPDELLPSFCTAVNRLAVDAPSGTIDFEEESFTPEQYRSYLELGRSTGGFRMDAVALTAEREVAAYSSIFLPGAHPETAWQGGTLVTGPHRGHRLGTAVKIANLRALPEHAHAAERVLTDNAETNGYMVSINVALGFAIIAEREMLLRRES